MSVSAVIKKLRTRGGGSRKSSLARVQFLYGRSRGGLAARLQTELTVGFFDIGFSCTTVTPQTVKKRCTFYCQDARFATAKSLLELTRLSPPGGSVPAGIFLISIRWCHLNWFYACAKCWHYWRLSENIQADVDEFTKKWVDFYLDFSQCFIIS